MDTWAIVELMGHVRMAGKLTEEEHFGSKLGRLDIPKAERCATCQGTGQAAFMAPEVCPECKGVKTVEKMSTQFFGGASVYRITPVSEEIARVVAAQANVAPISPWEISRALPAPSPDRTMDCGHTPEACDCDPSDEDWEP